MMGRGRGNERMDVCPREPLNVSWGTVACLLGVVYWNWNSLLILPA